MRLSFVILLFLCCFLCRAQKEGQALIDSLMQVLPGRKADTGKVTLFARISRLYYGVDPRRGFVFADSALALSQQLEWKRGIAESYNNLGLLTGDTGNNAGAREYFEKSLAINRALGAQTAIISNLNNIGRRYARENNFARAADLYFQALALADSLGNNEQAALVGTNLTALYILQQDFPKAIAYADSTIKKGRAGNALIHVSKALELLGVIYLQTGDTLRARRDFDSAMAIDEQLGNKVAMIQVLTNIGSAESDPRKALVVFKRVQQLLDEIGGSSENVIVNLANLGINTLSVAESESGQERRRDLAFAVDWLGRADRLSLSTHDVVFEPDIQEGLANALAEEGDYKAALEHYKRLKALNDSIFSQDSKNKIAGLESRRSIELKNKEIENRELQIANQRKTLWLLVIGLGLLGVIGAILYRQSVIRKRTNTTLIRLNNELSAANKIKAKFFAILSHDLRSPIAGLLNFLQLQKKKPGSMTTAEIADYWDKVGSSATALLETMEAMLLWSKGQMEHFKPNVSPVAIKPLFSRLERFFADTEGVAFSFQCEGDPVLDTDDNFLWTIMQNLTANAIKAVGQTSGARIDWRAWQEGSSCFFSISDNGPGVAPEQLKALYADDTAITGARQGLGLHIIRDLAKAIGCVITLRAQPVGTAFVLALPEKG
jgi:signal transduction histidine kinase